MRTQDNISETLPLLLIYFINNFFKFNIVFVFREVLGHVIRLVFIFMNEFFLYDKIFDILYDQIISCIDLIFSLHHRIL